MAIRTEPWPGGATRLPVITLSPELHRGAVAEPGGRRYLDTTAESDHACLPDQGSRQRTGVRDTAGDRNTSKRHNRFS